MKSLWTLFGLCFPVTLLLICSAFRLVRKVSNFGAFPKVTFPFMVSELFCQQIFLKLCKLIITVQLPFSFPFLLWNVFLCVIFVLNHRIALMSATIFFFGFTNQFAMNWCELMACNFRTFHFFSLQANWNWQSMWTTDCWLFTVSLLSYLCALDV